MVSGPRRCALHGEADRSQAGRLWGPRVVARGVFPVHHARRAWAGTGAFGLHAFCSRRWEEAPLGPHLQG